MTRPLALSDRQLQLVRDQFLQGVAARLTGEPSDAAVMQAINVTFDLTPVFLNDALSKKEKAT
jgi:hypothetical protein